MARFWESYQPPLCHCFKHTQHHPHTRCRKRKPPSCCAVPEQQEDHEESRNASGAVCSESKRINQTCTLDFPAPGADTTHKAQALKQPFKKVRVMLQGQPPNFAQVIGIACKKSQSVWSDKCEEQHGFNQDL